MYLANKLHVEKKLEGTEECQCMNKAPMTALRSQTRKLFLATNWKKSFKETFSFSSLSTFQASDQFLCIDIRCYCWKQNSTISQEIPSRAVSLWFS